MALKEQLIIRTAVGTVLGIGLNSFFASFAKDVLKPIFSRKSFDKLEHEFVITIMGIKINYGDLLGHFMSLLTIVCSVYFVLYFAEMYKIV
jgi:large-conductance mechanosensitive channel